MNDHDKTKEQLINELESLRCDVDELVAFGKESGKRVNFLQTIIDTIPSPIFLKDVKGRYQLCNFAFEKYTSLKKEEIIGKTDYHLNPKMIADPYHELDKTLLQSRGTQEYEVSLQDPDGSIHAVIFNKAYYKNIDGSPAGVVGVITDVTDRKKIAAEKEKLIAELEKAFAEVKTLSGLLPICSYCGKIRDDKGYWSRLEKYVQTHSKAKFSHGICPDCVKEHYPEYYKKIKDKTK